MKRIRTIEDFLNTLKTVVWTEVDGKTIKGEAFNNNVDLRLVTKFATSYHDIELMPLQVIAYIYVNDNMVSFWGAEGSSDNYKLVKFFLDNKQLAETFKRETESASEEHAKHVWNTSFLGE